MNLKDKRLLLCAEMVEGEFICDVGTDHGYLPAYLLESGKCTSAIAADINEKPLSSAKAVFEREGLMDKAQLILSDGLKSIPLEGVTDIVIAGMGGELIADILSADERVKSCGACYILQPMTRASVLRKYLAENGFETVCEKGAEDGKFVYAVIKCRYTGICRSIDEIEENIGKLDPSSENDRKYIMLQAKRILSAAEGMRHSMPEKAEKLTATAEKIRVLCE